MSFYPKRRNFEHFRIFFFLKGLEIKNKKIKNKKGGRNRGGWS
jgi:hypothetical protein